MCISTELATQQHRHDQVSHQHKDHQCLIFFPADYSEDLIVGDVWRCVWIPAEAQLRHLDTQKLPLYPNLSSYWHWACEPQWLQVHISCCYRGPYSPSPPPPFSPSPAPTPHYRSQIICPWTHRPSVVWSWILTLPKFLTPRDTYTQRNSHAHTSSRWLFSRPCDLSRRYLGVSSPLKALMQCCFKKYSPLPAPWSCHLLTSPGITKPDLLTSKNKNNIHNMHILFLSLSHIHVTRKKWSPSEQGMKQNLFLFQILIFKK